LANRRVIHQFFSALPLNPDKRDLITVKRSTLVPALVRTRALKIPSPPTTV
jgi:hypothetical protein